MVLGAVSVQQAAVTSGHMPQNESRNISADSGASLVTNLTGRIAVVKPIFSDTAYGNAFYVFYARYANSDNVTTDLDLLNVTVKNGWGWSHGLESFLSSAKARQQGLSIGDNVEVIDEINVTLGGLFCEGRRAFDVVILGFTEYVTIEEYYAYKEFVATGGTLLIMDACNFLAQVRYYPPTSDRPAYLSLVKGHGWEFNGTCAWKSVYHRWWDENMNWIGGNYWRYWSGSHYDSLIINTSHPISINLRSTYGQSIGTSYGAHEENLLQNFTDSGVIAYWHLINPSEYPSQPIVAYQHRYGNGSVFHSGIMASDVVSREEPLQAFLIAALRLALTYEIGDWRFPRDTALGASIGFIDANGNDISENHSLPTLAYCRIRLNTTIINSGGVTYDLTSACLEIHRIGGDQTYTTQSIDGNMTDPTGLNWEFMVNTTGYPDGAYKFQAVYTFTAEVDSGLHISWISAPTTLLVVNTIGPLRTAVVVVLATFASVMVLTYAVFLLDRKTRRGN